jgi:hypothetical protein
MHEKVHPSEFIIQALFLALQEGECMYCMQAKVSRPTELRTVVILFARLKTQTKHRIGIPEVLDSLMRGK